MASQFHVAFSSEIMGVGMIAGVPYMCTSATLMTNCMSFPWLINVYLLQTNTASARLYGNIDSTTNMGDDQIWIFSGIHDSVVHPGNADKIRLYYNLYVNSPSQIQLVTNMPAEHGQPTNNYGASCHVLNSQTFLNNCGYSAAFNLLNHIYGNLQEPSPSYVMTGQLSTFDQTTFTSYFSKMDTTGYVYIPTACQDGTTVCRLHIAFHGCQMGKYRIGDEYARHAGYNEVADLNNIIILYPQVVNSALNTYGCWDWFGYTNAIYFPFRLGPQMTAVHGMMDHIAG